MTDNGRPLLIEAGVLDAEADVFPYLPHTLTVEPLTGYDYKYKHLNGQLKGVYYVVSPKVSLNRVSKQINSPLTWTLDSMALAECDFGMHNERMAIFMQVLLDARQVFHRIHGSCGDT